MNFLKHTVKAALTNSASVRGKANSMLSLIRQLKLRTLFDDVGIDTVIDVGANYGQFGHEIRTFFSGEIHSFEPVRSSFEKLKAASVNDPNWHVYNLALGEEDIEKEINTSEKHVLNSFLEANEQSPEHVRVPRESLSTEKVEVRRGDVFFESLNIDFARKSTYLKMDTQGYDAQVFQGFGDKRQLFQGLQTEISVIPIYTKMTPWTETIDIYQELGFKIIGLFPVVYSGLEVIEFDCMMINETSSTFSNQ